MLALLAALLAALTVGTVILMALETDPILPAVRSLIASARAPGDSLRRDSAIQLREAAGDLVAKPRRRGENHGGKGSQCPNPPAGTPDTGEY